MLAKVAGKDTQTVVTALINQARKLPKKLYKSLTWDRGKELTDHRRFTLATNIDVYFCDPQSPWQRGSNKNANGLLRQYFPKGTDLSVHSQAHLNKVARQLNERPRETLQLKHQQRDLTPVLRRPVEPAITLRTQGGHSPGPKSANNGLMTARPRSSILGAIFASDLVDLLSGKPLLRHAGRIADFAEECIEAGGCDNPKQQQLTLRVREPVPRIPRDEYRPTLLEGMTYVVQYERSTPV
jgi:hypothetical protein